MTITLSTQTLTGLTGLTFQTKADDDEAAKVIERQLCYLAALELVDALEPSPRTSRLSRHYRDKSGELLATLGEVVDAFINDDLAGLES